MREAERKELAHQQKNNKKFVAEILENKIFALFIM